MNEVKNLSDDKSTSINKGLFLIRVVLYLIFLAGVIFLLAGSLRWTMGWVMWGIFCLVNILSVIIVPIDQGLMEERTVIKDDVKEWDKRLTRIPSVLFPFGFIVVGALDHRFDWSGDFAPWLIYVGIVVGIIGYLISLWAARVNKFYARYVRIQKERGHHTITSGPYQFVRHPGYIGLSLFCLATPLIMESIWAYIPVVMIVLALVIRTYFEDRTLVEELPGYAEYTQKTRYRLIPGIW